MKKQIFIFVFGIIPLFLQAQELNKTKIDERSQMEVLTGLCNRDGLKSDLFKSYFEPEYQSYQINIPIIDSLRKTIKNTDLRIVIVMGTWCGDSQEQIPRFYKIIDTLGFSESNITLYCVDRTKKTDQGETNELSITFVPTFIFYEKEKEIGRIIESPKISLERDMLDILSTQ